MVQVFLHKPGQASDAAALATEFDPGTSRRGFRGLELPLPVGTPVQIELSLLGAGVDTSVQSLVWQGRAEAVQFDVHVPTVEPPQVLSGTVIVRRDGVPIGRVGLRITISPDATAGVSVPHADHQHRFQRAFASYASPDRSEVLKRVQVLRAVGIECFQDVLDLEPGQRWERELYREIERVDLFLLFWSRAVKRSQWVRREVDYALQRQGGDPHAEPEIRPVLILSGRFRLFARPRVKPPWEELAHLHFNDLIAHLVGGRFQLTGPSEMIALDDRHVRNRSRREAVPTPGGARVRSKPACDRRQRQPSSEPLCVQISGALDEDKASRRRR